MDDPAAPGRPAPIGHWGYQLVFRGVPMTAVARQWAPGVSGPSGSCLRCSRCIATNDHCVMAFPIAIPPEDIADFAPYLDHGIEFDGQ